jgi:hypothetical protein
MTQIATRWSEDVEALAAAMSHVLHDMWGSTGFTATEAQARIAYEPFVAAEERASIMPIEEARRILAEVS